MPGWVTVLLPARHLVARRWDRRHCRCMCFASKCWAGAQREGRAHACMHVRKRSAHACAHAVSCCLPCVHACTHLRACMQPCEPLQPLRPPALAMPHACISARAMRAPAPAPAQLHASPHLPACTHELACTLPLNQTTPSRPTRHTQSATASSTRRKACPRTATRSIRPASSSECGTGQGELVGVGVGVGEWAPQHCTYIRAQRIHRVPKAKPGRDNMDIEIFGMSGVPEGLVPGAATLGALQGVRGVARLRAITHVVGDMGAGQQRWQMAGGTGRRPPPDCCTAACP